MDDPPMLDPISLRHLFSAHHRRLEGLLGSVAEVLETPGADGVARLWNEFREALATHLQAEEMTVIPGLTGMVHREVRVLLEEHRHLRRRCSELNARMEAGGVRPQAVRAFADELRAHASHEARTLYGWADVELDSAKQTAAVTALGESTQSASQLPRPHPGKGQ